MSTLYIKPTINTIVEELIAAKTETTDFVEEFLKILNGTFTGSTATFDTAGTYAQKLPNSLAGIIYKAFIYFNNPNPAQGMLFKREAGKDSLYWFVELSQPQCHIYKLSVDKVVALNDCLSVLEIRESLKTEGGGGSADEIKTNSIVAKTAILGEYPLLAKFNPTDHQDNHWHLPNGTVKLDDSNGVSHTIDSIFEGGIQELYQHDLKISTGYNESVSSWWWGNITIRYFSSSSATSPDIASAMATLKAIYDGATKSSSSAGLTAVSCWLQGVGNKESYVSSTVDTIKFIETGGSTTMQLTIQYLKINGTALDYSNSDWLNINIASSYLSLVDEIVIKVL